MLAPLNITQREAPGVVILELIGKLVADEGDGVLRDQVTSLVADGHRNLLLNLKNITHMDSGGVGALAAMHIHVLRRGGRLKLLCPSERACRVLRMTHLLSVFEVFDNEDQAIHSFDLPAVATAAAGRHDNA